MRGRMRLLVLVSAAAVATLAVGGCNVAKSQPTTRVIIVTLPPTPDVTASPTPEAIATATASASATATAPVPGPTAPPKAAAVPSTSCTGQSWDKTFWGNAAAVMKFDVYCNVLPSGWHIETNGGVYNGAHGGTVDVKWAGPSGKKLEIKEGAFCKTDADTCSPHVSVIGTAIFGDLLGSLDSVSGGGFAIYVSPGTGKGYTLTGSGMSQAAFVSIAAAVVKVAKS